MYIYNDIKKRKISNAAIAKDKVERACRMQKNNKKIITYLLTDILFR